LKVFLRTLGIAASCDGVRLNGSRFDVAWWIAPAALLEYALETGIRQVRAENLEYRRGSWFGNEGTELHTHRLDCSWVAAKNRGEVSQNLGIDGEDPDLDTHHAAVAVPPAVRVQGLSRRV